MLTDHPNNPDISDVSMAGLLKEVAPANMEKSLQCFKAWIVAGKNWG